MTIVHINLETIDTSNSSILYVSLDQFRKIFKFKYTDPSYNVSKQNNNIYYYTDISLLDISSNLNPMNSMVVTGIEEDISFEDNTVKMDFIRHIAKCLFKTVHGIAFFDNVEDMSVDLINSGNNINNSFRQKIINGNNLTEVDDISNNICKLMLEQMYAQEPARFDISNSNYEYVLQDTSNIQFMPFNEGDTISFKLLIEPMDAYIINGLSKPTNKIYKIILYLTHDVNKNEDLTNFISNHNTSNISDYYTYKE